MNKFVDFEEMVSEQGTTTSWMQQVMPSDEQDEYFFCQCGEDKYILNDWKNK